MCRLLAASETIDGNERASSSEKKNQARSLHPLVDCESKASNNKTASHNLFPSFVTLNLSFWHDSSVQEGDILSRVAHTHDVIK